MTTKQWDQSVTDSIKNLVNKDLGLQDAESTNESTETGKHDCEECGLHFSDCVCSTDCPSCGEYLEADKPCACSREYKPNKAKLPESFSDWLVSNNDSIEIGECCENCTEIDQRMANHDIYKNGNPFQ